MPHNLTLNPERGTAWFSFMGSVLRARLASLGVCMLSAVKLILGCWLAVYICHAGAEPLQAQETTNHSCSSIGGKYSFKGQDISSGESRSFFQVLWWRMAPSLWGDPSEIGLMHDVSQNTLQIKMYGEKNLRSEPRADGLFRLSCLGGEVAYESTGEGYSDGHHQKWHYLFRFSKDAAGSLIVHATYDTEDAVLFFWDRNRVEQSTKFSSVTLLRE